MFIIEMSCMCTFISSASSLFNSSSCSFSIESMSLSTALLNSSRSSDGLIRAESSSLLVLVLLTLLFIFFGMKPQQSHHSELSYCNNHKDPTSQTRQNIVFRIFL